MSFLRSGYEIPIVPTQYPIYVYCGKVFKYKWNEYFLSLWYKYSSELPKFYELKQEKLYFTLPLKYE